MRHLWYYYTGNTRHNSTNINRNNRKVKLNIGDCPLFTYLMPVIVIT